MFLSSSIFSSDDPRSYLLTLVGLMLLLIGLVVGINILVDPLWFFKHENIFNRVQPFFDERAQKTNWMQARRGWFDAVMLGSSTTTYIDQNAFAPLNLFNYSAALMYPDEYKDHIDRFSASNGPPKIIILGVDFFGSRVKKSGDGRPVETAIDNSGDPRYILGYLLSIDLLERSIITAGNSLGVFRPIENVDHYDRRNRRVFAEGMN